jgi:hypothetical protein
LGGALSGLFAEREVWNFGRERIGLTPP